MFLRPVIGPERAFGFVYLSPNKSSYLDMNIGHYRTNQAFIVELGFLGVHSDEDHQR